VQVDRFEFAHTQRVIFVQERVSVGAALNDCSSINSKDTLSLETI